MRTVSGPGRMIMNVLLMFLICGCAASNIKYHAVGTESPVCSKYAADDRVAVYWGAAWRTDQKEVPDREAIAERVIGEFFGSVRCFSVLSVSRTVVGRDTLLLSDEEILKGAPGDADRIFILRIEELGPNLMIYLSPILWATKNEVMFRFRALNARTRSLDADVAVHWTRGGPFTFLGADGIEKDFASALDALFNGQ